MYLERFSEAGLEATVIPQLQRFPRAYGVARAVFSNEVTIKAVAANDLLPKYLRVPQAERELKGKGEIRVLFIGSDHAGFELKEAVRCHLDARRFPIKTSAHKAHKPLITRMWPVLSAQKSQSLPSTWDCCSVEPVSAFLLPPIK